MKKTHTCITKLHFEEMNSQSGLLTDIANKHIAHSSAPAASASTQARIVVDNILSSFFWFDISEVLRISNASILSCFPSTPSPPKRLILSYALHNMGKKSMNRRNSKRILCKNRPVSR